MRILTSIIALASSVVLTSVAANAQELTGTLKKIKDSGVVTFSNRDSSIPFSYYSGSSRLPVGYSHDVLESVVTALKRELALPDLEVRYNLVTSQTRIPLVQNGTVDLECGSTTNTVERQRQVDFSIGIFEVGTRLLTRRSSGIQDFEDLRGKNVVTTAGTTSERLLKSLNADKAMDMNVIAAKDHAESFMMLETNRAVAFMMDDALLAGEMVKAKKPSDWHIVGTPQSTEIYGCMMRKGDVAFKKIVDTAIIEVFKTGSINSIYSKWFEQPIPPKGFNMNLPMSESMKKLIEHPTDKSAEQLSAQH